MMQLWRISMERINYNILRNIEDCIGTPFYIMDGEQYKLNVTSFVNAFRSRYPNVIAGYSFKTNYVPALCLIAKDVGAWAEVVSEMEYQLALSLGFTNIIFNGPIKKEYVLIDALLRGCVVNLDSMYEIDCIISYLKNNPSQKFSVGLRVNINLIGLDGESNVQCGLKEGRFGFTRESIERAILRLKEFGVDVVSLHGHTSSKDRAVENYKVIVQQMLSICNDYQLNNIKYFNVGGGFFGATAKGIDVSNKPTYATYANAILDILMNDGWFNRVKPNIVIEPGVSVVANVFTYVCKIFQHKIINGKNYLTTDGCVFDIKPTLHQNNLPHTLIQESASRGQLLYNVVGSTCMEKDVLLNQVILPTANYGDFLAVAGVGAYTISLTPTFINFLPPIVSVSNHDINIIRRKQTIEDVLTLYKYW